MRLAPLATMAAVSILSGCHACDRESGSPVDGPHHASAPSTPTRASHVGSAACRDCHGDEYARWEGSHHERAMAEASETSVVGDFDDVEVRFGGVRSRLFRRGDAFEVETDGPDGAPAVFRVRYTFGVYPLQQYLVELRPGRIQALPIAWDSRPSRMGGQRWFHLYGAEGIGHGDVLHWTRMSQSWESMCADCHSTGLITRYDVASDRFETRWDAIDVDCEACHGPASEHLAWADAPDDDPRRGFASRLDEREGVSWLLDPTTGNSRRSRPRTTEVEIQTCAPCHSRRTRLTASWKPGEPFLQHFRPMWISPPAYHADGQISGEDYVWGSFLQSRMYQQGVTCSDCHEPHGLGLRAEGAAICLTCHAASTFATTAHHGHRPGSAGADCLACHMPVTTYMQVDARRDHSLRVPRPALSASVGAPDPCTSCHRDRDAAWAQEAIDARGPAATSAPHWTAALAMGSVPGARAQAALVGLANDRSAPPLVRASVTSRLELGAAPEAQRTVARLLADADPLLRLGAADALRAAPPELAVRLATPLLTDPVRAVRLAGLEALLAVRRVEVPPQARRALAAVVAEYVEAQRVHAERAEAHVNLGDLAWVSGRLDEAEVELRTALRVNPDFVPAYVNLAELERSTGHETEAEALLRDGLARVPEQPVLAYALGLSLVRQHRMPEAVEVLRVAAEAPTAEPMHVLGYALALQANGQPGEAARVLRRGLARFGDEPSLRAALASMER